MECGRKDWTTWPIHQYPHLPGSRIGPGYSLRETNTPEVFDLAGMDKDEMSDLPNKMDKAHKQLESRRKYIPKHLTANPPAGYKYCPQCGVASSGAAHALCTLTQEPVAARLWSFAKSRTQEAR